MKKTYTMLVKNKPGCLDRIAGITRRFGWNIESMVAAETTDTSVTRITISLSCDKFCELPDMTISKLEFVISMDECSEDTYTFHEVLVARGHTEDLKPYFEEAAKVSMREDGLECTAWFLGDDEYIMKIENSMSDLVTVHAVRSGPMALKK